MTTTEKTGVLAMTVIVIIILAVVMTSGRTASPLTPNGSNEKIQDALGKRDASESEVMEKPNLGMRGGLDPKVLDDQFQGRFNDSERPANEPNRRKPKPEPKPVPVPVAREYTIQQNDTLGDISMRMLGTSRRWKEILELNPGLNPKRMRPGTVIKLPAQKRLKP